jgi:hypothetical protein
MQPSATQPPFAALPPKIAQLPVRLRDLLKREVCMDISRAHIEAAIGQTEAEIAELRQTRPPFLFLQGKGTRNRFEGREADAVDAIRALTEGLRQIMAAQPRLRAWVEDDLETFLRDSQPAYVQGLALLRYPDDWQRAVRRFDQRVASFRAALGLVQATLSAVPSGVALSAHATAFESLVPARQWAALLDYEHVFFNRIADAQRKHFSAGGETLKRQVEARYMVEVGQWARLEASGVRKLVAELLVQLDYAAAATREAYINGAALAAGDTPARSFVYPMWEALRQLMRLEILPTEVEPVVAETERMVAAAG